METPGMAKFPLLVSSNEVPETNQEAALLRGVPKEVHRLHSIQYSKSWKTCIFDRLHIYSRMGSPLLTLSLGFIYIYILILVRTNPTQAFEGFRGPLRYKPINIPLRIHYHPVTKPLSFRYQSVTIPLHTRYHPKYRTDFDKKHRNLSENLIATFHYGTALVAIRNI